MGLLKSIITSVFILVIALFIFSYIFDPSVKYQTKNFLLDIKEKTLDTNKISIPLKLGCGKKASELVPKYLIFIDPETKFVGHYPIGNSESHWANGEVIETIFLENIREDIFYLDEIRKGTKESENVNYFYDRDFKYNKKIISSNGEILGTRNFTVVPVLKKYNKPMEFEVGQAGVGLLYFAWKGFSDEVKTAFNIEEFNVKRYTYPAGMLSMDKNIKLCFDNNSSDETGEFVSPIPEECMNKRGRTEPFTWSESEVHMNIITEPNIYESEIYEIVGYEITDCNWA